MMGISNKSILPKMFLIAFFVVIFSFSPTKSVYAWDAIKGAFVNNALTAMREKLNAITLASAKAAAVKIVTNATITVVDGIGNGGSKVISDWKGFIVGDSTTTANTQLNDYLSKVTGGRGSSNYIPNPGVGTGRPLGQLGYEGVGQGSFAYGMAENQNSSYGNIVEKAQANGLSVSSNYNYGNYMQQLVQGAKMTTTERRDPTPTYKGNPSQNLFAGGNFNNLNLYLSGVNNPWAFNAVAQNKYQTDLAQQMQIATAQAIAGGGYKGTVKNGMIVTPGSSVKATIDNIADLPNKVLANARDFVEIAPALAIRFATNMIDNGIGAIQNYANRTAQNMANGIVNQVNGQLQNLGPAAVLGNENMQNYNNFAATAQGLNASMDGMKNNLNSMKTDLNKPTTPATATGN